MAETMLILLFLAFNLTIGVLPLEANPLALQASLWTPVSSSQWISAFSCFALAAISEFYVEKLSACLISRCPIAAGYSPVGRWTPRQEHPRLEKLQEINLLSIFPQ
jgi:hypothetical protein